MFKIKDLKKGDLVKSSQSNCLLQFIGIYESNKSGYKWNLCIDSEHLYEDEKIYHISNLGYDGWILEVIYADKDEKIK